MTARWWPCSALGLRIFQATGADIGDLGEEHGHRVLPVRGKGGKVVLVPLPPAVGRAIDRAIAGRWAARSFSIAMVPGWTGTAPPTACGSSRGDGAAARPRPGRQLPARASLLH
jgi:integrase